MKLKIKNHYFGWIDGPQISVSRHGEGVVGHMHRTRHWSLLLSNIIEQFYFDRHLRTCMMNTQILVPAALTSTAALGLGVVPRVGRRTSSHRWVRHQRWTKLSKGHSKFKLNSLMRHLYAEGSRMHVWAAAVEFHCLERNAHDVDK